MIGRGYNLTVTGLQLMKVGRIALTTGPGQASNAEPMCACDRLTQITISGNRALLCRPPLQQPPLAPLENACGPLALFCGPARQSFGSVMGKSPPLPPPPPPPALPPSPLHGWRRRGTLPL